MIQKPSEIKSIHKDLFYHDGRGPEIQQVHYSGKGQILQAIDYFNPDDVYTPNNLKHLQFERIQVFMFTPEEVYSYQETQINWGQYDKAAIVSLGQSRWLTSFSMRHLGQCNHYQLMFYDEILDVICENITAKTGGYKNST